MIHDPPGGARGAVDRAMGRVITLVVESVDSALAAVPNPVPSGGQLRTSRAHGRDDLAAGVIRVRKPVLAGIGAADWLAERLTQRQPQRIRSAGPLGSRPGRPLSGRSARPVARRS